MLMDQRLSQQHSGLYKLLYKLYWRCGADKLIDTFLNDFVLVMIWLKSNSKMFLILLLQIKAFDVYFQAFLFV